MRLFITLIFIISLISCRQDKKNPTIPKEPKVITTDQDATRTDAVDTLVKKPKLIDTLKVVNKEEDENDEL